MMRNTLVGNRLVIFGLFNSTEISWPFHFMSCFIGLLPRCFALSGTHLGSIYHYDALQSSSSFKLTMSAAKSHFVGILL